MKLLLMEEFHLSVYAPQRLRRREYAAIRRVLNSTRFHRKLNHAVRDVCRFYRGLRFVRATVTR